MESAKLKEYETLRTEILQKVEQHNTLLTFTITTTLASLTLAITSDSLLLYIIPFCILLALSPRIGYYRSAMAKLAAYILVFIEDGEPEDGLRWETRNNKVLTDKGDRNVKKKSKGKVMMFLSNYECPILSIICYGCLVDALLKNKPLTVPNLIFGLLAIAFVVIEFIITKRTGVDNSKKLWIEKWRGLKETANKQDQPETH